MPPLLMDGGIKRCFCLTCVCLESVAYIGPKSRTERPRKTKIDTQVAHITRDSDTTFKVKCQGHQAALLTDALASQASCSGWRGNVLAMRNCCYVLLGGRPSEALGHPRGRRGEHIVSTREVLYKN